MPAPALPRVQAFRSLADVERLASHLDALNLASRRPSPFGTFAYIQTFMAHDEHAKPGQEVLFLVAFDGESPVGFLPLRKVPERLFGLPHTVIRCLMTHDNDRPRAVSRAEDEPRCCEAFYRYLMEVERGWSYLELNEQDAASGLLSPPPTPALRRHYVRRFPNNPNATLALSSYRTLGDYLHGMDGRHRKSLRHDVRKLLDGGPLELVCSSDPAALPALFDLYLDLERRSWKAGVGGHIGRHPERIAFFRRLLGPEQPMRMTIHLLLQRDLPIAGMVTGTFEGDLHGFEEAFDEAYRRLAPGNTMMMLLIRDAIEKGYRSVNMFGNYAYYKAHWLAIITETEAVQLYRKGSLVHAKALFGEVWRKLRPPLTQREADFNLSRRGASEANAKPPSTELPLRAPERERATATLRSLEAASAKLERLSGDALQKALLEDEGHGKAGAHGHGKETRP